LVELARGVADEFLLNALYNAALSQRGPEDAQALANSSTFVLEDGSSYRLYVDPVVIDKQDRNWFV